MDSYRFLFILFVFVVVTCVGDSAGYYNCSNVCQCSRQNFDVLGTRNYFVLNCSADAYDVENALSADVYVYESTQPMDTNFLSKFYNLKGLLVNRGVRDLSALRPIHSLRVLNISFGSMAYLPALQLFRISASLLSVSLTYNQMEFLSDEAFGKLDNLLYLNLSHNSIDRLPQGLFYSLRKLKMLDLSYNELYTVSSADFNGLTSLEWLNIGDNFYSSMTALDFGHQDVTVLSENSPFLSLRWDRGSDLRQLTISSPELTYLTPGSFSNSVIETLIFTNCLSLKAIEAEAFVNMTIIELVISNNPSLVFVDRYSLVNIEKLSILILSYNSLKIIPQAFSLIDSINTINAVGNPLFCDCNLNWVRDTSRPEVIISTPTEPSSCVTSGGATNPSCAPRPVYLSQGFTAVDEGRSVHMRCKVSGLPRPTITWKYGGSVISNGTNMFITKEDLVIPLTTYGNSGLYQCMAHNTAGILHHNFTLSVIKDDSKIIILKIGQDMVEFSWTMSKQQKYKAILINVKNNTQTVYPLQQFPRSRYSQGFTIAGLQKSTTYRVCLAFETQQVADSDRCETITTLQDKPEMPSGVTDYSLYGIIIASIVTVLLVAFIVCVCMASKRRVAKKRREDMVGMVSESSYGLMTTSFSQRSHLSSMYDNPAANVHTPVTPTGPNPPGHPRTKLKRTVSDPLISSQIPADTSL